jgi:hypothetical protein
MLKPDPIDPQKPPQPAPIVPGSAPKPAPIPCKVCGQGIDAHTVEWHTLVLQCPSR